MPREKLLSHGAAPLSNVELISILLATGYKDENVLDLARRVLEASDASLVNLSSMSARRLMEIKGIGEKKAATLAAAFEIGRRFYQEAATGDDAPFTSPEMVYALMAPVLKGLDHEEFWVLYLNRSFRLTGKEKITMGSGHSTVIDTLQTVKKALERNAYAVIMVHNHPSGSPRPGGNDKNETEKLRQALSPLGISLVDHVVVCDDCYFSFSDNRMHFPQK